MCAFAWDITLPPAGLTPNIVLARNPDARNEKSVPALHPLIFQMNAFRASQEVDSDPSFNTPTQDVHSERADERVRESERELCVRTTHERTHVKAPKAMSADLLGMHWPE